MNAPLWTPSPELVEQCNITRFTGYVNEAWGTNIQSYPELHQWSVEQSAQFWQSLWNFNGVVGELGAAPYLLNGDKMPGAQWFPNAEINYGENLLRRRDDTPALMFRGEDKVRQIVSSAELYDRVSQVMQALSAQGVGPGDRVAGYLPNMPEAAIAMIATTSLGAIWSSCSPDFGIKGVVDRFSQVEPKVLLGVDAYYYNGKTHQTLSRLPEIAQALPSVQKVVVVTYVDPHASLEALGPNAVTWNDFSAAYVPAEITFQRFPFDHPLFILFSSGTTGKPKCIVHGIGGTLLTHIREHLLHGDLSPGDRVFGFTTTGWMMWNWLISALACDLTVILYDGSPFYPDNNAMWDLIDEDQVTLWQTGAKYIDAIKKAGMKPKETHSLASFKTLHPTGSVLVPEGFDYVYDSIKSDLRVSSVTGGTDICGCFVMGSPTLPVYRGELQCIALGMKVEVFNDQGESIKCEKGELVCTAPFPSMPVGFWGDTNDEKYHSAYFEEFDNVWAHGDYAEITEHDGMIVYGRSDTVLNPGGVRIGTAEIYGQVELIDEVVESCVIGQEWDDDTRVVLFVVLRDDLQLDEELVAKIKSRIRQNTTPRHVPAKIVKVVDIPKTATGKIVEVAVRNMVSGIAIKNKDSLGNPEALELFRDIAELQS